MRIAIIGTRGIPNHYGGFEQFAEYLSIGLVKRGFGVTVYNSHNHPYQGKEWNGVQLIHLNDPEHKYGTFGQFIYDLNCIRDLRKRQVDIILQLGYTSSSVWGSLLPRRVPVTTNMDGLEWKRTKYSKPVKRFLQYAEKLGIRYSDYLISDSIGIQQYLKEKYKKESVYIPYGSHVFEQPDDSQISPYDVRAYLYNMLIARLEPENSIETILTGAAQSPTKMPFLVVGKHNTKYGDFLKEKYAADKHIRFIGGIYDINILNNLRYFSKLYFHGHTVGGTNPSLLEAMGSGALICAHNNLFNRSILGDDALYFEDAQTISRLLNIVKKEDVAHTSMLKNNLRKIKEIYNWDIIIDQYVEHFLDIKKGTQNQNDIKTPLKRVTEPALRASATAVRN
jgi:glycosyltransferase involved in cell wall biosynthesis